MTCFYAVIFAVSIAASIALSVNGQAAIESDGARKVLYINSYHSGYGWSDDIQKGLSDSLFTFHQNVEISIEFLDTKRFPAAEHNRYLKDFIQIKYTQYKPEVIVVSDNYAINFTLKYRDKIFPNIPIVFCGYNMLDPNFVSGIENITGINEEIAVEDSIEMALQIHGKDSYIVFITSTSETSTRLMHDYLLEHILPKIRKKYSLTVLTDNTEEELKNNLDRLPKKSILFLLGTLPNSKYGRAFSPQESSRIITSISPFPIYTYWDFYLDTGVLGGSIVTGYQQGYAAGEQVKKILDGTSASNIPLLMKTPTERIFDFNVMKKFNLSLNDLPPDSRVINLELSFWEEYWVYLAIAVAGFTLIISIGGFWIVSLQISVQKRTQELEKQKTIAETLSKTDELTRLNNRRAFLEQAKDIHHQSIRLHRKYSVITIDIDHFKRINDTYGHAVGDKAIRTIADVMKANTRKIDVIGRLGGEEFAIICPETDAEMTAYQIARQLRIAASAIIMSSTKGEFQFTISLGVSEYNQSHRDFVSVLKDADDALYQAKRNGRNRVELLIQRDANRDNSPEKITRSSSTSYKPHTI